MSCKKDEEYILLDMLLYGCTLINLIDNFSIRHGMVRDFSKMLLYGWILIQPKNIDDKITSLNLIENYKFIVLRRSV
ncbi:MAG: hypothetical protein U9P79_04085 [Candidatus Cloacimonadota bacterium]|nr:hypothetical protein [Candidatus Cloacimonadota bacterium]